MWYFWLIPLVIIWSFGFRRRWEHYPRRGKRDRQRGEGNPDSELATEVGAQRNYISDLEARVAELENRLDFTERLLSSRHRAETTA